MNTCIRVIPFIPEFKLFLFGNAIYLAKKTLAMARNRCEMVKVKLNKKFLVQVNFTSNERHLRVYFGIPMTLLQS